MQPIIYRWWFELQGIVNYLNVLQNDGQSGSRAIFKKEEKILIKKMTTMSFDTQMASNSLLKHYIQCSVHDKEPKPDCLYNFKVV